jgi:hypothetical protein
MSRQNKVNPDHYTQGGRLSPDDLARERQKQSQSGLRPEGKSRPLPPWMLPQPSAAEESRVEEPTLEVDRPEGSTVDADADEGQAAVPARPRPAKRRATRPATRRAAVSRRTAAARKPAKPRAKTAVRSTRSVKATTVSKRSANRRGAKKVAVKSRTKKR